MGCAIGVAFLRICVRKIGDLRRASPIIIREHPANGAGKEEGISEFQGDRTAFDRLMLRHQETIAQQMRRFSTDVAVMEELTQTVFVKAYLAIGKYRPDAPFLHWLRSIASRTGYEHWRGEHKNDRSVRFEEHKHGGAADPDAHGESSWQIDATGLLARILPQLSHDDRITLDMLYVDGMSVAEVAECMGWGVSMTKMRSFRTKRKLRKILKAEGIGPEWLAAED